MSKLIDLEGLRTFKTKFAEEINKEISDATPSFTFASGEDESGTVTISFASSNTPQLLTKDSVTTVNITESGDNISFSCAQKPSQYSGGLFDFIKSCHAAGRILEFKTNAGECIHSYEINDYELTVFKYASDLVAYKLSQNDSASKSKISFADFAASDFASDGDIETIFSA